MKYIYAAIKKLLVSFFILIFFPLNLDKQKKYFSFLKLIFKKKPLSFLKNHTLLCEIINQDKENIKIFPIEANKTVTAFPLDNVMDDINNILKERAKELVGQAYINSDKPKILIVSHELSRTGAPKACLDLAIAIKKIYGKSPVVAPLLDGPLKNEYLKNNIPLINITTISLSLDGMKEFFKQFDVIICNSCTFPVLDILKNLEIEVPVIWWSHEVFENEYDKQNIKKLAPFIKKIWSVSPLTKKCFSEIGFPDTDLLMYGLDDIKINNKKHDKVAFAVMGSIERRKAQDIFLNAIKNLDEKTKEKAVFYIIGKSVDDDYLSSLKEIETGANVIFTGELTFEKLLEYYEICDAIVIPSRNDPMPIVATHGFMFNKLCICSDKTGTSLLINNKENGIIFKNEDIEGLSRIIADVTENLGKYEEISKNGRTIYLKYFSMEIFEHNIKNQINNLIS